MGRSAGVEPGPWISSGGITVARKDGRCGDERTDKEQADRRKAVEDLTALVISAYFTT